MSAPSSAPPVFEQVGSLPLYTLSSSGSAGVPGYWAGFRARAALGRVASLDDAWRDPGGIYLFCGKDPTGQADKFLKGLDSHPLAEVRFLWIEDPTKGWEQWTIYRLHAVSSGSGPDISWRVSSQAAFRLGNYAVEIEADAALTQSDPATAGYGVSVGDGHLTLAAPGGVYPARPGSARLPLAGGQLGAWAAALDLGHGGNDGEPDDMTRLGVELRYAVPSDEPGEVTAVSMPILSQEGKQLSGYLSFDRLHPVLAARTSIGFFPHTGSGAAGPGQLRSSLRTALGYAVLLTPAAGDLPLWPARLAFCSSPVYVAAARASYDHYYLAPDGVFALAAEPDEHGQVDRRMLLGLSGGEFAELAPDGTATALFEAGRPAFAPGAIRAPGRTARAAPGAAQPPEGGPAATDGESALTDAATTAYLAVLPPAGPAGVVHDARPGLTYYAQPQRSPWYAAGGGREGFLDSRPLPTATLPTVSAGAPAPPTLPVGGYAGLHPSLTGTARVLEETTLAPARRGAIGAAAAGGADSETAEPILVVTPQGIAAEVVPGQTPADSPWRRVILASFPGTAVPELAFTGVGPKLRAAMQASELFFVVADPDAFMRDSSVSYQLDQVGRELLRRQGVPVGVLDRLADRLFQTEADLDAAIQAAGGESYRDQIRKVTGLLKAAVEDWAFQVSPRSWRTGVAQPTVMLVKYASRSLAELVADLPAWGWPEAAGDAAATQKRLTEQFKAAAEAPEGSPYLRFYHEVVADPAWNGMLFMNAPVAAADLPKDLQFVTAGINPDEFYAHHVGFSLTSVQVDKGKIGLGQSAAFGLLHYEDLADQVLNANTPLAFKTQRLSVRFAGGVIADLSAQVELMVNRLFGEQLTMLNPEHGNNLVLAGSYQRQHGVPSYAFALTRQSQFALNRSVLESVEVLGTELRTATGSVAQGSVVVEFALSGNLRFAELAGFDLFSYGAQRAVPVGEQPADGYLRFSGLVVRMKFDVATPEKQTFSVDESRVAVDLPASVARPGSLAAGFPVQVSGLVAGVPDSAGKAGDLWPEDPRAVQDSADKPAGQRPEDLGYTSILAPIDQVPLTPPWYGLTMKLDLGTLGALAGSAGITASLLAAWAPGKTADDRPVFLGLQLASARSAGVSFPVQGVLKVGFRSFEFLGPEQDGKREYLLKLHHLALSVLAWSFPPGDIDVILFGDPDAGRATALGWYAAYRAPDAGSPPGLAAPAPPRTGLDRSRDSQTARRLTSGRRALPPASGLREPRRMR